MSDEETDNGDVEEDPADRKNTTAADRAIIFYACKASMQDGRLKTGIFTELAGQLGFKPKSISRQWHSMQAKLAPLLDNQDENLHNGIILQHRNILFETNQSQRRKNKYKYDRVDLEAQVRAIPLKQRQSLRSLSAQIGVPISSVDRFLRGGSREDGQAMFKRHVSKLKPTLTDENKVQRWNFALDQINMATWNLQRPRYAMQYDKVHVDEKWFYLSRDGEKYILVNGEVAPQRHTRHKNFIVKVMFLCAQARPRWDPHTHSMWDGKIGIWPIGRYVAAQRTSKHRPAGTIEWENDNICNDFYRDLMINNVFTEIMNKWPVGDWNDPTFTIKIQQDGAGGHCSHDDEYLTAALEELGLADKVSIYTQPANSPDLNILDLGMFNALQAAYYKKAPLNAVQLITMVEETYNEYPVNKINRIFLSLMCVYNMIIEHHGDNQFEVPHMNKDKLEREGRLPVAIQVTPEARQYLP
jgi:hypothetical protein